MAWTALKAIVAALLPTNGMNQISAADVRNSFDQVVDSVGALPYHGKATPTLDPGSYDGERFYLTTEAGTYTNFDGIVVAANKLSVLKNTGSGWVKDEFDLPSGGGTGDMLKSVYDTNDDGKVNAAATSDTADSLTGAPGNSKYYGTDSGGAKGYFDLPSSGSSDSILFNINQDGIGLLVSLGDVVAQDATEYILANATDGTKTAIGVVVTVTDNDNIVVQTSGIASYTKSALTKGDLYYLATTDGDVTSTVPTNFIQPIFEAIDTNQINIHVDTMIEIDSDTANINFADLQDKDRAEQDQTNLGTFNGPAAPIDLSKSNNTLTLGGNITSVSFTNLPVSTKRVTFVLNVLQDATGGRTIDWTGSGVRPPLGDTSSELQPNTTPNSLTQYWLYWDGSNLCITMLQIDNAL